MMNVYICNVYRFQEVCIMNMCMLIYISKLRLYIFIFFSVYTHVHIYIYTCVCSIMCLCVCWSSMTFVFCFCEPKVRKPQGRCFQLWETWFPALRSVGSESSGQQSWKPLLSGCPLLVLHRHRPEGPSSSIFLADSLSSRTAAPNQRIC